MENAKLKDDLKGLRRQVASDSDGPQRSIEQLMNQFEAMSDELDRRREECIQLRTVLANTTLGQLTTNDQTLNGSRLNGSRMNGGEPFVEDNEILMAFETQKRIIRHLENELQQEKSSSQNATKKLHEELARLRNENEQQQKVPLSITF